MTKYTLVISPHAHSDIRNSIQYYNNQQKGLGIRFYKSLSNDFKLLIKNPYFGIRYSNIRCLPMKKFPFLIHFSVEEEESIIYVEGVIHTSLEPDSNWAVKSS